MGSGDPRPGSAAGRAATLPAVAGTGRWGSAIAALLLLLSAILAAPAPAQTFPRFTGLVVDAAGVLPPDRKAALEAKLDALQQQTGKQLVVATVPDLQGYPIEDYGYRLLRSWGVGLKGADNGAILLVAPRDRKVRVEVGYGLEGTLTDAFTSVVIQNRILPAFKAGDIPGGIAAGVDALDAQLRLPDDQAQARAAGAIKEYDRTHHARGSVGSGVPLGLIFWLVLVGAFLLLRWMGRGRSGQSAYRNDVAGGSGGSSWPIWLWAASEMMDDHRRGRGGWSGGGGIFGGGDGGGGDAGGGGWMGGGFTGGGGGSAGGGGASGSW